MPFLIIIGDQTGKIEHPSVIEKPSATDWNSYLYMVCSHCRSFHHY